MMWPHLVFVLCVLFFNARSEESRLVQIAQGKIRGYKHPSGVFAYYDVPYASTPTGSSRYKGPNPAPIWLSTFDAVDRNIVCPQVNYAPILPPNAQMVEDCLVASVFVPEGEMKRLPVAVYIHGGGFQIGYGNMQKLTNLLKTRNMIVVTFNYRLGTHGFLCLGTNNVPGNAGMKDQIALLRWIQKNIEAFGGDPDEVTIVGGSAGSAAVELLVLSKAAKGFFKRAILESGAALAAFAVQTDPLEKAKSTAKLFNFENVDDINALEEFYLSTSLEVFNSLTFINNTDSTFGFSPCVERDVGEKMFLDDAPVNILKEGNYNKVPMLCGFADMEGFNRLEQFNFWKNHMNEKFSDFMPIDLKFNSEDEKEDVARAIKEFYFGYNDVSEENIVQYINFFSDIMFTYPTLKSIQLQMEAGNDQIYLYMYTFVDEDIPYVPHTEVKGANHCAQSIAVLDGKNFTYMNEDEASESYKKIKRSLREMWSNFIYTGKPVPEKSVLPQWPPVKKPWSPYMELGRTIELKESLLEERTLFWDEIYKKHYRVPVAPPALDMRLREEL